MFKCFMVARVVNVLQRNIGFFFLFLESPPILVYPGLLLLFPAYAFLLVQLPILAPLCFHCSTSSLQTQFSGAVSFFPFSLSTENAYSKLGHQKSAVYLFQFS